MAHAEAEGARHWMVEAALGGGLALCLITAAHAALPKPPARLASAPTLAAPRLADLARPARVAPAPPAPPPLIAIGEPLPGYAVGSPFGLRQLPWEEAGRLHAGVDIEAPAGAPVLAAADGVVVRLAADPGYGRFVEIRHAAGLTTRYGHLSAYWPGLAAGAAVKAGEPVGRIGSTGASTGAHLHFEIRDAKDRPLNPELLMGRSFAAAADLPLREALRVPRRVRVAYVSMIPKSKKDEMQARAAEAAAGDASAVVVADAATAGDGPLVIENPYARRTGRHRVHARLRF